MPTLYLVHADEKLRKALKAGLETAWPALPCRDMAPGDLSPGEGGIIFTPTAPPIRFKTMVLQIQQMLRDHAWPSLLELGEATLDTRNREWQNGEDAVMLTEKEVAVLVYLSQRNMAASREDLLRDVWEYASDVDTHTIETHIYRLRQKIEKDPGNPQFLVTTKDGYQLAMNSRT